MSIVRERDIEAYLVAKVKAMGGEVRKIGWIGRRGAPDRLVFLPFKHRRAVEGFASSEVKPCAFWVELKAPGVKPEAHQLREHDRMRAFGQRVFVIDSFNGVAGVLQ